VLLVFQPLSRLCYFIGVGDFGLCNVWDLQIKNLQRYI
jgi:hypothetical protein